MSRTTDVVSLVLNLVGENVTTVFVVIRDGLVVVTPEGTVTVLFLGIWDELIVVTPKGTVTTLLAVIRGRADSCYTERNCHDVTCGDS